MKGAAGIPLGLPATLGTDLRLLVPGQGFEAGTSRVVMAVEAAEVVEAMAVEPGPPNALPPDDDEDERQGDDRRDHQRQDSHASMVARAGGQGRAPVPRARVVRPRPRSAAWGCTRARR
jgi:hypothetical protein